MTIDDKMRAIEDFVHSIRDDIDVVFSFRKNRNIFATVYYEEKKIVFKRPLFMKTIESCLHCACHEVAHIVQYERQGWTAHDREFEKIKDHLINTYGTPEIKAANSSSNKASSHYVNDTDIKDFDEEINIFLDKVIKN